MFCKKFWKVILFCYHESLKRIVTNVVKRIKSIFADKGNSKAKFGVRLKYSSSHFFNKIDLKYSISSK